MHLNVTLLIWMRLVSYERDMTQTNLTWLIRIWHDAYECDMTRMNVCDMTHMDVTWLVTFSPPYIETENKKMSISYFDFLTDESWHICMWYDLSWMSHDTRKCDMTYYQWVVTHMNVIWLLSMSHDTHECEMPHEFVMTHINVTWCTWVWHDASAFDICHMNIHDVFVRHTFSLGLSRTKHTHTHTHTHYDTHTHTHT